jgi:hypothetical protein
MATALWAHAPDVVVMNGDVLDEGVYDDVTVLVTLCMMM